MSLVVVVLCVVVQGHRGWGRDSRRRRRRRDDDRRRGGRLGVTSMVVCVGDARAVVTGYRRRRAVVTMPHARNHACRRRKRDDDPEAEEHRRVDEGRDGITVATSIPNPPGPHDDIELEQQRAEVGGRHELGCSCVRTEGRAGCSGQSPQCERADIEGNARGQYRSSPPYEDHSGPHQLEKSEHYEEQP